MSGLQDRTAGPLKALLVLGFNRQTWLKEARLPFAPFPGLGIRLDVYDMLHVDSVVVGDPGYDVTNLLEVRSTHGRPRGDVQALTVRERTRVVLEELRRMPGVVQSRHPVYRVAALGPLADKLTAGHERSTSSVGIGTPFEFMAMHETQILGIGKSMQVLTQAHHIEHAMGDAFPVPRRSAAEPLRVTLVDGADEISLELNDPAFHGRFNIWKLRKIVSRSTANPVDFAPGTPRTLALDQESR